MSAITTAFGEAYIAALEALIIKNDGEPPTIDDVLTEVRTKFSQALTLQADQRDRRWWQLWK